MVKEDFVGAMGSSQGVEKDGEAERNGEDSLGGTGCLSRGAVDVGTQAQAAWHPRRAQAREMGKPVGDGVGLAFVNFQGKHCVKGWKSLEKYSILSSLPCENFHLLPDSSPNEITKSLVT